MMKRMFKSADELMSNIGNMSKGEIVEYYWSVWKKVFRSSDYAGSEIPCKEDLDIFDEFANRVENVVSREYLYDYDDCDYDD